MKKWHWYLIGLAVVLIALFILGWKAASILGVGLGGYEILQKKNKESAKKEEKVAEEIKEETKDNEDKAEQLNKENKKTKEDVENIISEQGELNKEKQELDKEFNKHFKGEDK
jgi:uncharacterized protein HemX